jgi:hypothetical protein
MIRVLQRVVSMAVLIGFTNGNSNGLSFIPPPLIPPPLVVKHTFRAQFSWAGLSPEWPSYDYKIICVYGSNSSGCEASGSSWVQFSSNGKTKRRETCRLKPGTRVNSELVAQFDTSFKKHLIAVPKPLEVIEHTDDYPHFNIVAWYGDEAPSLPIATILSTSNTRQSIPWNVKRGGRWYIQKTGEIPTAYFKLIESIPCKAKR